LYALAEIPLPALAGPEGFDEAFWGSLPAFLSFDFDFEAGDISKGKYVPVMSTIMIKTFSIQLWEKTSNSVRWITIKSDSITTSKHPPQYLHKSLYGSQKTSQFMLIRYR
jgi:hypothetical protein